MAEKWISEVKFGKEFDKALRETAREVTDDIEDAYQETIREFYDDYDPRSYVRTLETRAASDHFKGRNKPRKLGTDTYIAGIEISADNIEGKPYRADKDWVFQRTYEEGIHGFTGDHPWVEKYGVDPGKMEPPPDERMNKKMDKIEKSIDRQIEINMDKMLRRLIDS